MYMTASLKNRYHCLRFRESLAVIIVLQFSKCQSPIILLIYCEHPSVQLSRLQCPLSNILNCKQNDVCVFE